MGTPEEPEKEYIVSAKRCAEKNPSPKSTIVEYDGKFIELFGHTYDEKEDPPPEFPMLVKIIKKQNGDKICSIIIDILKEE